MPLVRSFMFVKDEMRKGNVTFSGDTQEKLDDLFDQLDKARIQLQSDQYSRLVAYLDLPEEGDETFEFLDEAHAIVAKYYSSDCYDKSNKQDTIWTFFGLMRAAEGAGNEQTEKRNAAGSGGAAQPVHAAGVLPGAALAEDQPQKQTIHIASAQDLVSLAETLPTGQLEQGQAGDPGQGH